MFRSLSLSNGVLVHLLALSIPCTLNASRIIMLERDGAAAQPCCFDCSSFDLRRACKSGICGAIAVVCANARADAGWQGV